MKNIYHANRRSDECNSDYSLAEKIFHEQHLTAPQEILDAPVLVNRRTTQQTCIEIPLTASQLAEIVPLHPVTLLKWAREGRIPHRRLSARKIVFLPSEINRWLVSGSNRLYPVHVGHVASTQESEAA